MGASRLWAKSISSLPEDMRNMLAVLNLTSLIVYIASPLSFKDCSKHTHELHQLAHFSQFSIHRHDSSVPKHLDLRAVFNFNQAMSQVITSLEPYISANIIIQCSLELLAPFMTINKATILKKIANNAMRDRLV